MSTGWIVVTAAIVNVVATALIVLGAMVRVGYKIGCLETKVEALWLWFLQRSKDPGIRKGDHQ